MCHLISYGNLASIYVATKEYQKALTILEQLEELTPLTYIHQLTLANIYALDYEYTLALELIQQALIQIGTAFNSTNIQQNPLEDEVYKNVGFAIAILSTKGYLLYESGKEEEDLEKIQLGLTTIEQSVKLEEEQKTNMRGFETSKFTVNRSLLSRLNYLLDGQFDLYQLDPTDAAFDQFIKLTERRKAMQLLEVLSEPNLPTDLHEEEQQLTKNIQLLRQHLDLAQTMDSVSYYENALFEANIGMENFLDKVRQFNVGNNIAISQGEYATTKKTQESLGEGVAMLTYSYHNKKGYIAIISQTDRRPSYLIPHT